MPVHAPHPRRVLLAGLALALSLGMLVLGLAHSAPALAKARAHRSACRHSTAGHAKRRGHPCATPRHKARVNSKTKTKAKARVRHGSKRHGAQPAVTKAETEAASKKPVTKGASPPPSAEPASCEDGSSPLELQSEVYECEDGSEPGCEDHSEMTVSSDGSTLLCTLTPGDGGAGEAECEAGTVPSEADSTPAGRRRGSTLVCSASSDPGEPTTEAED